jgi:hypothetical protein
MKGSEMKEERIGIRDCAVPMLNQLMERGGYTKSLNQQIAEHEASNPIAEMGFDPDSVPEIGPEEIEVMRNAASVMVAFILSAKSGNEATFKYNINETDYELVITLKGTKNVIAEPNKRTDSKIITK